MAVVFIVSRLKSSYRSYSLSRLAVESSVSLEDLSLLLLSFEGRFLLSLSLEVRDLLVLSLETFKGELLSRFVLLLETAPPSSRFLLFSLFLS